MTDAFPDQIPGWWNRFGVVLLFQCRRVTDPESWLPRYDGELILTDKAGEVQLRLTLTDLRGEWGLAVGETISGLQILDTWADGYEQEARYHVRDFESGAIDLFCQDIRVDVLEGADRYPS